MKRFKCAVACIGLVSVLGGCDSSPRKSMYIETDRGLLPYSAGFCTLGMLTNNDRDNILDESGLPLTCTGYVNLTKSQAAKWVAE